MIQNFQAIAAESIINESRFEQEEVQEDQQQIEQPNKSRVTKKQDIFSLTLLNAEKGEINLPQGPPKPQTKEVRRPSRSWMDWLKRKQVPTPKQQDKSQFLPCPKVVKLSDALYGVYNANSLTIYRYHPTDRSKYSKKKIFDKVCDKTLKSNIVFVRGYRNTVLVSMVNQFKIYFVDKGNIQEIQLTLPDSETEIIGGGIDADGIVIFSRRHFRKYKIEHPEIRLIQQAIFYTQIPDIKFIDVLKGQKDNYFFVFSQRKKVKVSSESDKRLTETADADIKQIEKQGEAFHIIEFQRMNDSTNYSTEDFQIAKIPQQGMFDLTKIFYLGNKTFLVSLHEQIVVIRKQYSRYIIVDNICVTSNRLTEESTTGQLVLIDKSNIIYNQNERIYVYSLIFDRDLDKLRLEPVDDFKGVDEAQIILYDGILLTPKNTTIQVLFYFNVRKVRRPGRQKSNGQDPLDFSEKDDEKNKLKFSVYGIVQLKPVVKLVELLQAKRPAQEIVEFRSRFQILPLEYYKSQWSVSAKSLNDIVTNLLQINDEAFIQKQLDHVLRKETHTLGFLLKIQQKQIVRLRAALTQKLEKAAPQNMVVQAIQRLLESKMFEKKLKYQNQFEAYKAVDFIDIKKLRETSLRQEIKLLSCKGFERRLKRFLNEFKFLAIANFEDIFEFLMANKDQNDIQLFFLNFSFILPEAVEKSFMNCFVRAVQLVQKKQKNDTDDCTLWDQDNKKNLEASEGFNTEKALITADKPQTLEIFAADIYPSENSTTAPFLKRLKTILQQFKESDWFKEGAFKKHCMLDIDQSELTAKLHELKSHRAYDILFKFLYQRIEDPFLREAIIDGLVADARVPPSYRANVNIRVEVYQLLNKLAPVKMRDINPPEFIIMSEPDYFAFLDKLSPHVRVSSSENLIFTIITQLYVEKIGDKGFFEERFNVYLMSNIITISNLNEYLGKFRDLGSQFQVQNQHLLNLLVRSSMRNLSIVNVNDTLDILKVLSEIDLLQPNPEICAKVMQGFLFNQFFKCFSLEYSFEDFYKLTEVKQNNPFFKEIIEKYCKDQFDPCTFRYNPSQFEEHKTAETTIRFERPIDFLKLLKYIVDQVGFEVQTNNLVEMFLLNMFLEQRYDEVKEISEDLFGLIEEHDPKDFLEELILKHVDKAYHSENSMEVVFRQVIQSLDLVDPPTLNVKHKRAFLELSLQISRLQYGVLSKFEIEKEIKNKPMVFLIHLLQCLDKEAFEKIPNSQVKLAFQLIYEKMTEATNQNIGFKSKAKQSIQFQQFEVQRGYYYLRNGKIKQALDVCEQFSSQTDLYYHDLVYAIVVAVCKQHKYSSQTQDAFSTFIQFIIANSDFDANTKTLVVTDCLKYLLELSEPDQITYMREVESQMKQKPKKIVFAKHSSLLDTLMKGVIEHTLGYKLEKDENEIYYTMFMHLLRHNPVEAFYFLMKNPQISISRVMSSLQNKDDNTFQRQFIAKYFTLAIYIRSLRKIVQSFYPTYTFFQYKQNHLADDKTRRDINILAEKLYISEMKDPDLPKISEVLMKYYKIYMEEVGLSADIDLAQVDLEEELQTSFVNDKQRVIDKNQLRLRQQLLQTQAKFNALTSNLQLRAPILSSPTPELKTTPLPDLSLPQLKTPDLPSKTYEKYEDVKSRQMTVLKKMQQTNIQTAKVETKFQVDKIIEKFKLQRMQKMSFTKSREPSEVQPIRQLKKRQDDAFSIELITPIFTPQATKRRASRPQQYQISNSIQRAEKPYEDTKRTLAPYTQRQKPAILTQRQKPKINKSMLAEGTQSVASSAINFVRKKMDENYQRMSAGVGKTLEDHKIYLKNIGQKEIFDYLSKLEMVKGNLILGGEFIKKMFENCRNFQSFLKTLQVILKNFENFEQVFEKKSIKIATQAIRIDSKTDPRKLFDLKFFQNPVPNFDEESFNRIAFKRLKPNIARLLDDQNVHTLSKMMMYGLGMDRTYEYKVYKQYLQAKLDEYLSKNFGDKEMISLIEKVKNAFPKMPSEKMKKLFLKKKSIDSKKIIDLALKFEDSINRTMKVHVGMVTNDDKKLLELFKTL